MSGKDVARLVEPISRDIVKEIAMDIGKSTVAYVEVQYPGAIKAVASTFRLSLRNHVYNEIMAALETTDEAEIIERLARRKKFRREQRAAWKRIRENIAEREAREACL